MSEDSSLIRLVVGIVVNQTSNTTISEGIQRCCIASVWSARMHRTLQRLRQLGDVRQFAFTFIIQHLYQLVATKLENDKNYHSMRSQGGTTTQKSSCIQYYYSAKASAMVNSHYFGHGLPQSICVVLLCQYKFWLLHHDGFALFCYQPRVLIALQYTPLTRASCC